MRVSEKEESKSFEFLDGARKFREKSVKNLSKNENVKLRNMKCDFRLSSTFLFTPKTQTVCGHGMNGKVISNHLAKNINEKRESLPFYFADC